MGLTREQHDILLRPLNGSRVAARKVAGRSLSYLEAWDVKAHLTRIFGFCNWDGEVIDVALQFEVAPQGERKNWSVGYMVTYRLTIRDEHGQFLCRHTETAVGSAQLPQQGEAHDMAVKTAESDALKRAAINLGTQFGLSLYNNGSTADIIRATLVQPDRDEDAPRTPEKAPVTDEQPEQASEQGTVSIEVAAVFAEFSAVAEIVDNGERILEVAALKQANSDYLNATIEVDGQKMTVGRYADLVAAGAFSREEKS
jgi:recombination DNA repair RAD52 pathway protein